MKKLTKKRLKEIRVNAVLEYNRFIRANLKPENPDYMTEPENFRDWVRSCEECESESLESKISFIRNILDSASGREGQDIYCESRRHFLRYAEGALERRFPEIACMPF